MPPRSTPFQRRQAQDSGFADLPVQIPGDLFRKYDPQGSGSATAPYGDLPKQARDLGDTLLKRSAPFKKKKRSGW